LAGAYVPIWKRKHYYCGGVWFAKKIAFLDFCKVLSYRTRRGIDLGCATIWHDESYLNWFASSNKHNELSPLFCSDGKIDAVFLDQPFIRAVDKPTHGYHGK